MAGDRMVKAVSKLGDKDPDDPSGLGEAGYIPTVGGVAENTYSASVKKFYTLTVVDYTPDPMEFRPPTMFWDGTTKFFWSQSMLDRLPKYASITNSSGRFKLSSPAAWWNIDAGQDGTKQGTGADQHKGYYRDMGDQYETNILEMCSAMPDGDKDSDWRTTKAPNVIQLIQDGIDAAAIWRHPNENGFYGHGPTQRCFSRRTCSTMPPLTPRSIWRSRGRMTAATRPSTNGSAAGTTLIGCSRMG